MTNATATPGSSDLSSLRQVTQAKEDLADRLDVAVGQIEVVEAKAVVWPNPGLGCPQPGMAYKQVPVDGMLIRLRVEGRIYEYHSGGTRDPFLCEQQPMGKSVKPTPRQLDQSVVPSDSEDDQQTGNSW